MIDFLQTLGTVVVVMVTIISTGSLVGLLVDGADNVKEWWMPWAATALSWTTLFWIFK